MVKGKIIVRRAWRSQIKSLSSYLLLSIACIMLSRQIPGSVITGKLFGLFGTEISLHFPLFWLIPLAAFIKLIIPIYDAAFTIDPRGVELRTGIISTSQKITLVRFEDVKTTELYQSLVERILDIGTIGIATAATGRIEMLLDGIGSPSEFQEIIQSERDRRRASRRRPARPALEQSEAIGN